MVHETTIFIYQVSLNMIIANPLYDVVFKYLLEDLEIARGLLSAILGEEVQALEVKPQETAIETGGGLNILRFDFKAVVRKADGSLHKVLIELQKAKKAFDVSRFRKYLGENYRKEDEISTSLGATEKRALPIITIYFLGFSLENIPAGVVKINREYRDMVTHEVLDVQDEFVELLTHDSYVIQVRKLPKDARSELERILQVFSPIYQTPSDKHQYDYRGEVEDALLQKMLHRLGRAIASDEIRDKMEVEDEIERIFDREMQKKQAIINEQQKRLDEQEAYLAEQKQRAEIEKQRAEAEKQRAEAEKQRAETEKQRADQEYQKNLSLLQELEALKKQLGRT